MYATGIIFSYNDARIDGNFREYNVPRRALDRNRLYFIVCRRYRRETVERAIKKKKEKKNHCARLPCVAGKAVFFRVMQFKLNEIQLWGENNLKL